MNIEYVSIGGWFQRTGLHMFEIYDFLCDQCSPLTELKKAKLKKLHVALDLKEFSLEITNMEYIRIVTKSGVKVKIYEDGLIRLKKLIQKDDVKESLTSLRDYYEKKLSPALSYLFSLGAPVPKELAQIKSIYPYFVVLQKAKKKEIQEILDTFKETETFGIDKKSFEIHRGDKLYIINNKKETEENIAHLIEERIFIREFKTQMHKYLNIHRHIWEKIDEVKEQKILKWSEISPFLGRLEEYEKTITLIETRIRQMGLYIRTRESIAHSQKLSKEVRDVSEFKYDTMANTLKYVQHIWDMTQEYLKNAISVFRGLRNQSTDYSIRSLTVVASMGVGAGLIGLLTDDFPTLTWSGALYFITLAAIGWGVNKVLKAYRKRKTYHVDVDSLDVKNFQ